MADNTLTIEQLAAQTGITVRQARGLLAPPEVRLEGRLLRPGPRAAARADAGAPGGGVQTSKGQAAARRVQRRAAPAGAASSRAIATPYETRSQSSSPPPSWWRDFPASPNGRAPERRARQRSQSTEATDPGVPSPSLLAVAGAPLWSVDGALAVLAELDGGSPTLSRTRLAQTLLHVREVWRPFQDADMPPVAGRRSTSRSSGSARSPPTR